MEGLFQKAYRNISDHLCVNNLEKSFTRDFAELDGKDDCINYLLKMTETTELVAFPASKTSKCLTDAMAVKITGNKHFQQKKYEQALMAYNKALRMVPLVDDEGLFAVCFANRSAALFSLQQYENCLSDIELAIKHGYPSESFYKLLIRRAKCHQFIRVECFEDAVKMALQSLDNSKLSSHGKEPWQKELALLSLKLQATTAITTPELFNKGQFPALCPSAALAESNEFGRFVQATEDISSGDVVLVEKPYCSVSLPQSYLTHCCHCQKRADYTPYPCRSCADVVYCGQDCEEFSWQAYHRFECDNILSIKSVGVNMGHLALRSALQTGYNKLKNGLAGNLQKLDDYENVYNLQGHAMERPGKDMFWRTVAAIVLAYMCDVHQWSEKENALTILATAILHHMDIFPCNAHEISEIIYDKDEPCKSALVEIGAGIYKTLSMFNHSCDPSVVRTFCEGNICVMNALSPIAREEQIYDNYGCLYATHPPNDRRRKLQSQYYFQCSCIACVQDWGLYNSLHYQDDIVYKCSKCSTMLLPPHDNHCDNCLQPFDKRVVDEILSRTKEQFDVLLGQLFSIPDATPSALQGKAKKLQDYSQLVNKLVFRPYKTLNDCQEALKHVYSLLGNSVLKSSVDLFC